MVYGFIHEVTLLIEGHFAEANEEKVETISEALLDKRVHFIQLLEDAI